MTVQNDQTQLDGITRNTSPRHEARLQLWDVLEESPLDGFMLVLISDTQEKFRTKMCRQYEEHQHNGWSSLTTAVAYKHVYSILQTVVKLLCWRSEL